MARTYRDLRTAQDQHEIGRLQKPGRRQEILHAVEARELLWHFARDPEILRLISR